MPWFKEGEANYWDSVKSIAQDIISRVGYDRNAWSDAVHEDVDGSSWIIYTVNHETVLDQTSNSQDERDVREMCGDTGDWRKMRQVEAYMSMVADVHSTLRELKEEYDNATPEEVAVREIDEADEGIPQ